MRPPCELVQREYLPLVRSILANRLKDLGHSQNQIAEALGITQAAVSKYWNQKEGSQHLIPAVTELTTRLAQEIANNNPTSDALVREVCATCMSLRIGSDLCIMHRESVPSLGAVNCQICSELLSGSEPQLVSRASVLSDLQESFRIIQRSRVFSHLVPQVRANLVACNEKAIILTDVAGIPGRITLIEGRARALVGPRFGASKHTASLLLEMRNSWSHVRACMCLSGRLEVVNAAKSQKVKIYELSDSESDPIRIAESVKQKLSKSKSKLKIGIHVPGGLGVEPILYIFGSSATELGELCEEMGHRIVN